MRQETVERHLKAAEKHIASGAACIARLQTAIARLERREGHEGYLQGYLHEAIRLLAQFLEAQALHLAERDRLISELSRAMTDRRIAHGQFLIAQQREMISRLETRGEDSRSATDQLALLEGTQAALLSHRDRLDEMAVEDAGNMGRVEAVLLSLLRAGTVDAAAQLSP